jgi:hypothetical protein
MVGEAHTEEQAAAAPLSVHLLDEGGGGEQLRGRLEGRPAPADLDSGGDEHDSLHGGSLKDEDDSAVQEPDRLQLGRRAAAATWRTNGGSGSSSMETSGDGRRESQASGPHLSPKQLRRRPALIQTRVAAAHTDLKKWR